VREAETASRVFAKPRAISMTSFVFINFQLLVGKQKDTARRYARMGRYRRRGFGCTLGWMFWFVACWIPCIVSGPALRSSALNSFNSRLLLRVHAADSN